MKSVSLHCNNNRGNSIEKFVSINVTTTQARLNLCSQTVWSLVHQSVLPAKIVLWVSSEKYLADDGINSVPMWVDEINSIRDDILAIKWVKNTGPYRKIIPALRCANDNDILVYADDDVVYGFNWLYKLLETFRDNQDKVVASRVRELKRNIFGHVKSYLYSTIVYKEKTLKNDYVITGVGGVVIKKSHIASIYIELEDFVRICPTTDDLWISKILELSSTAILACPQAMDEISEIQHVHGLTLINNFDYSKGGIMVSLARKIKIRLLGQMGIPVCKNDVSMRSINDFFVIFNRSI
ncbi:glycosyltransferase [Serratia fonticola]|uniref:glycosyltransferase n=1 Tax=Serratia fonticola TaxID=47917 RepID=UPI003AADACB2